MSDWVISVVGREANANEDSVRMKERSELMEMVEISVVTSSVSLTGSVVEMPVGKLITLDVGLEVMSEVTPSEVGSEIGGSVTTEVGSLIGGSEVTSEVGSLIGGSVTTEVGSLMGGSDVTSEVGSEMGGSVTIDVGTEIGGKVVGIEMGGSLIGIDVGPRTLVTSEMILVTPERISLMIPPSLVGVGVGGLVTGSLVTGSLVIGSLVMVGSKVLSWDVSVGGRRTEVMSLRMSEMMPPPSEVGVELGSLVTEGPGVVSGVGGAEDGSEDDSVGGRRTDVTPPRMSEIMPPP